MTGMKDNKPFQATCEMHVRERRRYPKGVNKVHRNRFRVQHC